MLYMPWRKESFLPSNDFQRALDLFSRKKEGQQKTFVEIVKEKLFPFKNSVEEARAFVEANTDADTEIGETLDPESTQLNEDERDIGVELDLLSAVRDPGELIDVSNTSNSKDERRKYMRIDISNLDMLYQSAGQLAPEQRIVFNRMIEFCTSI